MTYGKRLFDIIFAISLITILLPLFILLCGVILIASGRPVFYVSERMKTSLISFNLWKFRSMSVTQVDAGVSGGDKKARVTSVGKYLRKYRLDEIPQLWNVLKGDMSFVGPRPPLRTYVEKHPEIYSLVLQSRPGVTGLATLVFHAHEEELLKHCTSPAETDEVYSTRCVPIKAKLDLIYQRNSSWCFDMSLLAKTVVKVLQ